MGSNGDTIPLPVWEGVAVIGSQNKQYKNQIFFTSFSLKEKVSPEAMDEVLVVAV